MTLRAGVDVGGTFTDVVIFDETSQQLSAVKTATDYTDPIQAIVAGLRALNPAESISALHHATTLSTNAILQNQLPRGALLTTRGFRDVLDIGRIQRPEEGIYDFTVDTPQPLIQRALRIEVTERIGSRGEVVTALDEADLRRQLQQLKQRGDIETIAICGLFAFVNPSHEQRIAEIVRQEMPAVYVSLSSRVAPEIREFERSSTVVLDALLKPILTPYLQRLDQSLAAEAVAHTRIMMASGGLSTCAAAADKPINTINSGPSAGVLAAANLARQLGIADLITIDMGGTSLDIGVVEEGHSVQKYESKIAGFPVRAPAIDVAAVAAGGGSLALVDELGYIQVDRESAGSAPGPACYGRGGKRATITDADVVLGRLGIDFGGRGGFTLQADRAVTAFEQTICQRLQVDVATAASSVLDVIQARMVKAIASNTVEKGLDIRQLPLLVYGGAGPTHGVELAQAMGMSRVLVPYLAGNFSALGLLLCAPRWDTSCMLLQHADQLTAAGLSKHIVELEKTARSQVKASGMPDAELSTRWSVHMRYAGQSYDLAVDLGETWAGALDDAALQRLLSAFHDLHQRHYAYSSQAEMVEFVQLRVSVLGQELDFPRPQPPAIAQAQQHGEHKVYFTQQRRQISATMWNRSTLNPGFSIPGPAVLAGEGSSTLVPPGWTASVDSWLNLDIQQDSR